ncbi:MAG: hypothetical protein RL685_5825 [Pseudomonadota bacterium]|jgi:hypothetical protein
MISKTKCLTACLGALLSMAACGGEDDGVQSSIERLSPANGVCVTTDTCPYGHCSTEDGECNLAPGCAVGGTCPPGCFGVCVAAPSPSSR